MQQGVKFREKVIIMLRSPQTMQ